MSNIEEEEELFEQDGQEEEIEYVDSEENSGPSSISLAVDKFKVWLNKQNKTLVLTISGLVVAAIGVVAYIYMYKLPREEEANTAIWKTEKLFENDSFELVLKTAPGLADKYSGTKAGNRAAFMAGRSYLEKGEVKKAIEYLEDAKFDDEIMSIGVVGLLGDAYAQDKNLDKALSQYEKAAKMSEFAVYGVHWNMKAARIYEKKEDWEKALKIYEYIKKEFKDDNEAAEIDKYIGRAKAKLGEF